MRRWPAIVLAGLVALGGGEAAAHKTNLASGRIVVAPRSVEVRLKVSAHDLAVALGIPTDLAAPLAAEAFAGKGTEDYAASRMRVVADGAPCVADAPRADFAGLPADVGIALAFRCSHGAREITVVYGLFFDIDPSHRNLGTIEEGGRREEYLIDRAQPMVRVAVGQVQSDVGLVAPFARILWLGVEHIAAGIDHLLFILALMLGVGGWLAMVKIVTAFTLAHSLTLSLAWFGWIDLPGRLVESLIALSVAYVAVENLYRRGDRRRWPIAFAFGLVHGLGFYGALRALDLGAAGTVTTLLAFNLGVEVGQLAVVGAVLPLLRWGMARPWYGRLAAAGSAGIALAGVLWFVERAFLA